MDLCGSADGMAVGVRGCYRDKVDEQWYTVPCADTPREMFDYMGMSARTANWRYSTFCKWDGAALAADWSACTGAELCKFKQSAACDSGNMSDTCLTLVFQTTTRLTQACTTSMTTVNRSTWRAILSRRR